MAQLDLANRLRRAVSGAFRGFLMCYQPIVDSKTGRCCGAEALLRWQDEDGQIVPPGVVIPILEQSGLMLSLEQWIIQTVCTQCGDWIHSGVDPRFFVNINLSSDMVGEFDVEEQILKAVRVSGLKRSNIVVEVAESSALVGAESMRSIHSPGCAATASGSPSMVLVQDILL